MKYYYNFFSFIVEGICPIDIVQIFAKTAQPQEAFLIA